MDVSIVNPSVNTLDNTNSVERAVDASVLISVDNTISVERAVLKSVDNKASVEREVDASVLKPVAAA